MTVVAKHPVSPSMIRKYARNLSRPAYVRSLKRSGVLTGVLVTLEHQLGVAGSGVPELDSSILGAA